MTALRISSLISGSGGNYVYVDKQAEVDAGLLARIIRLENQLRLLALVFVASLVVQAVVVLIVVGAS